MAKYKFYTYSAGVATIAALMINGVDYKSSVSPGVYKGTSNYGLYIYEHTLENDALSGQVSASIAINTSDGGMYSVSAENDPAGSFPSYASGNTATLSLAEISTGSAPVIVSVAAVDYAENRTDAALTVVATDADGDTPVYSIDRGVDAILFDINPTTGELTFKEQPDFENPQDDDGDNVYSLIVQAAANGDSVSQSIEITVTDASEADAQTSIDTSAVAQMLGGELTIDGVASVISGLAVAADAADTANRQELLNLITPLQTAVQEAQQAADRLESYEMGQIEDLLTQLVETDGFQSLLETASVTVNGKQRSVASILQAIAEAPKTESWKKTVDTDGEMNGVIATLTNGTAVTFNMTTEAIDANTNKHIFTVNDFAGTGIAKSFYMVMKAKALDFGGLFGGRLTNAKMGWMLEEVSNIVFDIVGSAPSSVGGVTVPDYNADGATGNA